MVQFLAGHGRFFQESFILRQFLLLVPDFDGESALGHIPIPAEVIAKEDEHLVRRVSRDLFLDIHESLLGGHELLVSPFLLLFLVPDLVGDVLFLLLL